MHIKAIQLKTSLLITLIMLSCLAATSFLTVQAKPTLHLNFYKDNGYNMGNDMNGLWTVNTDVSADVVYVEFYVDDELQLNDTTAPFSWPFDTNNYTLGVHTIKVVAYDSAGEQAVEERQPNFVGFPLLFIVGIISFIVIVTVVSFVVVFYRARRRESKEQQQKYGNS
jgi:hypothetical protein